MKNLNQYLIVSFLLYLTSVLVYLLFSIYQDNLFDELSSNIRGAFTIPIPIFIVMVIIYLKNRNKSV
jgi:hypothetical protein